MTLMTKRMIIAMILLHTFKTTIVSSSSLFSPLYKNSMPRTPSLIATTATTIATMRPPPSILSIPTTLFYRYLSSSSSSPSKKRINNQQNNVKYHKRFNTIPVPRVGRRMGDAFVAFYGSYNRKRHIQQLKIVLVKQYTLYYSSATLRRTFSSSAKQLQEIMTDTTTDPTTTTTIEQHASDSNTAVSSIYYNNEQKLQEDLRLYQNEIKRQMRLLRRIDGRRNKLNDPSTIDSKDDKTIHDSNKNTNNIDCDDNDTDMNDNDNSYSNILALHGLVEFEKKFDFSSNPRFDEQFYIDDARRSNHDASKKDKYQFLHHSHTAKKSKYINPSKSTLHTTKHTTKLTTFGDVDAAEDYDNSSSNSSTTATTAILAQDETKQKRGMAYDRKSKSSSKSNLSFDYKVLIEEEAKHDEMISVQMKQYNDAYFTKIVPSVVQQSIQILTPYIATERLYKIESILKQRTQQTRFLFENPVNPSNVFACMRTLDAFGIQNIDIVLNKNQYIGKAALSQKRGSMRTAAGSSQWLTINTHLSTKDAIESIRQSCYQQKQRQLKQQQQQQQNIHDASKNSSTGTCSINNNKLDDDSAYNNKNVLFYASDLNPSAKDIRSIQWDHCSSHNNIDTVVEANNHNHHDPYVCIVMGNEENGISDEMRQYCDYTFTLPMVGFAESFNLSVATAITLAHLSAQSSATTTSSSSSRTGPIRPGDIDIDTYNCLLLKGIINSIAQKKIIRPLLKRHNIVLPSEII